MPSFLIAAATSNSGKTTFTMGLLRALRNRGINVQPFKCGPDYIDTMFHHIASGNESVNLDTFMSSEEHVKTLYNKYGEKADCRIVEGVMGLFDGYDKWHGSSAEIAMMLDISIILIVNAKSVAYSVAPLIYGFKHFNPQLKIAGVVFNMVASENHYAFLRSACEDAGVECLGYLPRNEELVIPGRHLGLTITAKEEMNQLAELAAKEIEAHVDIDFIIQKSIIHSPTNPQVYSTPSPFNGGGLGRGATIAIAHDEAFNFTYRANIDVLKELGEVVFFSPLRDERIPDCDMLYLPGGYPELFAEELSTNTSMRESIRSFAEQGGRIFAECGGFMYLCKNIDGKEMCGIFPMQATMEGARLHLGYRRISKDDDKRHTLKGHEFHYSSIIDTELPKSISIEQCQISAKGTIVPTPIYHYKNVTAGYTHWYWADKSKSEMANMFGIK